MSEETTPTQETKNDVQQIKQDDNSDLFVKETDTFECKVRFYRKDNAFVVENVDEEFNDKDEKNNVREIVFKCKYPSSLDLQTMLGSEYYKSMGELKASDLTMLQLQRLSILIRSWSLPQELSELFKIDVRVVKGMLIAISSKIGMNGII